MRWVVFLILLWSVHCSAEFPADKSYLEGIQSSNSVQRQDSFNNALRQYLELDQTYHPAYGNGVLYHKIAETYYQLQSYPWALLYAYRALQLNPANEAAKKLIVNARSKLGIENQKSQTPFRDLFFFHSSLSIPEKLQLLTLMSLLVCLLMSCVIWIRWALIRMAAYAALVCWGMLAASLFVNYYLSPIEAVVVESTFLYRDAGKQFAQVRDFPTPSGEKVTVLDILPDGMWMKVLASDGTVGFVSFESVRII